MSIQMPYKLLTLLWGTTCLVASARPGDYSAKLVRGFGCQPTLDPYVSFWGRVPGLLRLVAEQDLDLTRNSQNGHILRIVAGRTAPRRQRRGAIFPSVCYFATRRSDQRCTYCTDVRWRESSAQPPRPDAQGATAITLVVGWFLDQIEAT